MAAFGAFVALEDELKSNKIQNFGKFCSKGNDRKVQIISNDWIFWSGSKIINENFNFSKEMLEITNCYFYKINGGGIFHIDIS